MIPLETKCLKILLGFVTQPNLHTLELFLGKTYAVLALL